VGSGQNFQAARMASRPQVSHVAIGKPTTESAQFETTTLPNNVRFNRAKVFFLYFVVNMQKISDHPILTGVNEKI
jgi:hypothetical protein